ncbi:MAG: LLM class flavin-dependent oxidoreductase, partial [Acidobacteria bacterium]|nr:LLM class flavin-dependent oxidoreductase [Acidobacteriota bacterium]
MTLAFGIASLGDWIAHPHTGVRIPEEQRFREMVEEGLLAERLGATSVHYGEHHFTDYVLSSPPILMMAVA